MSTGNQLSRQWHHLRMTQHPVLGSTVRAIWRDLRALKNSSLWSICNLLRGPYKRNGYRKVILPLTVLRRFDCPLAPTKAQVLAEHPIQIFWRPV